MNPEINKLLELAEQLPNGLRADWQGTNHYEMTVDDVAYWWLSLRSVIDTIDPDTSVLDCKTDAGQKLGLLMDLAAAVKNALPSLQAAFPEHEESDPNEVIKEIMGTVVTFPRERVMTVKAALSDVGSRSGWKTHLSRSGVREYADADGHRMIFFAPGIVCAKLLCDSRDAKSVVRSLSSISGAIRTRQRIGSLLFRGVAIPRDGISAILGESNW